MLMSNLEAELAACTKELARVNFELARVRTLRFTSSDLVLSRCYEAEIEYWEESKDLCEIRIERLKDKLEEFKNE